MKFYLILFENQINALGINTLFLISKQKAPPKLHERIDSFLNSAKLWSNLLQNGILPVKIGSSTRKDVDNIFLRPCFLV